MILLTNLLTSFRLSTFNLDDAKNPGELCKISDLDVKWRKGLLILPGTQRIYTACLCYSNSHPEQRQMTN